MSGFIHSQVELYKKKYHTNDPFGLPVAMGAVALRSDACPRSGLRGYRAVIDRTKYVVLNAKQPEEEQRVVAGHEAGHLIIRADRLRIGALKDRDVCNVVGKREREANLFAADFLIRDEDVQDLPHEDGADFISVARQFGVPSPFFAFRLCSMVAGGYAMRMPVELNSRCLKYS